MNTKGYFSYIVNEIHTTIAATVDDDNHPVTCAIDMMDYDENSLYFLTATGKNFYDRLKKQEYLAFTALIGEDTLHSVAISVRGKVRELGPYQVEKLLEKNTYMYEIYPTEESRTALTVFQMYEGTGEWFDLRTKPVERASFSFGNEELGFSGYYVNDMCIACRRCRDACPQNCIDFSDGTAEIIAEHCLRCGNCAEVCPEGAIEKM